MPLGLADNGVVALNPAADVIALVRQHPSAELTRGDHAVEPSAPHPRVDEARILNLLRLIVKETTQLLAVYTRLERLHQLDHQCLLITDLYAFARHLLDCSARQAR